MPGPVVHLSERLDALDEHWSPKVLARVNDQYVKIAKVQGEFVWHDHAEEDELFYILKGELTIEFEDGTVTLRQGDLHVVPRGVRHRPVARDECWLMLVEPVGTLHTGSERTEKTRSIEEQLE
ncbi:MAG: cupin domain-containing protein [Gemmatimonadota bacterium]